MKEKPRNAFFSVFKFCFLRLRTLTPVYSTIFEWRLYILTKITNVFLYTEKHIHNYNTKKLNVQKVNVSVSYNTLTDKFTKKTIREVDIKKICLYYAYLYLKHFEKL